MVRFSGGHFWSDLCVSASFDGIMTTYCIVQLFGAMLYGLIFPKDEIHHSSEILGVTRVDLVARNIIEGSCLIVLIYLLLLADRLFLGIGCNWRNALLGIRSCCILARASKLVGSKQSRYHSSFCFTSRAQSESE
jgi:hypothetical protein